MDLLLLHLVIDNVGFSMRGVLLIVFCFHLHELLNEVLRSVARRTAQTAVAVGFLAIKIILKAGLVLLDVELSD